ncbi:phosphotransferase [Nonomuraea wenchangensis]
MPHPEHALLDIAAELLPGISLTGAQQRKGQFHDVVIVPGVAAVRIARRETSALELPRRTELLFRLAQLDLPFKTPIPLGPAATIDGRTAVAVSWIDGAMHPKGGGDPSKLRDVLEALASIDVALIEDVLDEPHAYAGRGRWEELLIEEVVPRLPTHLRTEAQRRVNAALGLGDVPASLVHGDLAGENMHWSTDGDLIHDRVVDEAHGRRAVSIPVLRATVLGGGDESAIVAVARRVHVDVEGGQVDGLIVLPVQEHPFVHKRHELAVDGMPDLMSAQHKSRACDGRRGFLGFRLRDQHVHVEQLGEPDMYLLG